MLVIAGTIPFDPAQREAFHAACVTLQEATRAEEGCLLYAFSADLEDPGMVHIIEKWTSEEALLAHFAQPHMKAFGDAMSAARRGNSTVVKFQVSEVFGLFGLKWFSVLKVSMRISSVVFSRILVILAIEKSRFHIQGP